MQEQKQKQTERLVRWTLLAMPLVAAAHMAFYYPLLPNPMASHFGPSGRADGWMSKPAFAVFYLVLVVLYTALFNGMGWLLQKTPDSMINIPDKEYWLAPERRERTLRTMGIHMAQFGIAISAFFFAVMHSIFLANLRGGQQLGALFFVYLAGFLIFTTIWSVNMVRAYRRPR